mmetsp:Transcript_39695/g.113815  ORF Transcript_39695/g.113815 Transcript_39695/m.113815 type:complete len:218 (-) Transcript_39695:104-757(-)
MRRQCFASCHMSPTSGAMGLGRRATRASVGTPGWMQRRQRCCRCCRFAIRISRAPRVARKMQSPRIVASVGLLLKKCSCISSPTFRTTTSPPWLTRLRRLRSATRGVVGCPSSSWMSSKNDWPSRAKCCGRKLRSAHQSLPQRLLQAAVGLIATALATQHAAAVAVGEPNVFPPAVRRASVLVSAPELAALESKCRAYLDCFAATRHAQPAMADVFL